jgi:hypothetical protein
MIPLPLLIVICIIGIFTVAIVIDAGASVVRSIIKQRANPTHPLSACEMTSSKR